MKLPLRIGLGTVTSLLLFLLTFSAQILHAQNENPPASQTNQSGSVTNASSAGETTADSEDSTNYHNEQVSFGHDITVKKDEISRGVVVIGGNALIEGTVDGNLVVIFGSAKVTGKVNQNMVVILGSSDLGAKAEVGENAVVVGGKLKLATGATIGGERVEIVLGDALPALGWVGDWVMKGLFLARPLPPQFAWVWMIAAILFVIYLLVVAVFPQPIAATVNALETRPAGSFFAGLLGLFLFGPIVFLLVVSVAGILVLPILVFAILAALFFGKVAVYLSTGRRILGQLKAAALQKPALALLVGFAVFCIFYMIPVLGFVVWGMVTAWGLGAVLVACFSGFHKEQEPVPVVTTVGAFAGNPGPVAAASPIASTVPPMLSSVSASPEMISLQRAGFWIRFWATVLDLILLGTLAAFIGPFFLFLWAGYHIGMWTWKGTTIGGIVLGIKIIRTDGTPVNFSVALVRSLSSFFSALVLFMGFFWAGWDRNKQAWHDKIAGTVVVKVPKGTPLI